EPGEGRRPGRPTGACWARHPKVSMSGEGERRRLDETLDLSTRRRGAILEPAVAGDRGRRRMIRTLEAMIDERGTVRLLEAVELPASRRALVTILDEEP